MTAGLAGASVDAVAVDGSGYPVAEGGVGYNQIVVIRYTASGAVDTTFGTDGATTVDLPDGGGPTSLVVQPDGKILVGGEMLDSSAGGSEFSQNEFIAVRFNSNGTLDSGFGVGGIAKAAFGSMGIDSFSMAMAPDGKIVMGGDAYSGTTDDSALVRFNANGTLDTSFGTGGKVTVSFGAVMSMDLSVTVQPDGKILAAGFVQDNTTFGAGKSPWPATTSTARSIADSGPAGRSSRPLGAPARRSPWGLR